MKKISIFLAVSLLMTGLILLTGRTKVSASLTQQDIPNFTSEEMAQQFSQLTLQMRLSKGTFLQLEPIVLYLTLNNPTDNRIWGHTYLATQPRFVHLFVRRSGETEWREWEIPTPILARVGVDDGWIAPRAVVVGQFVIRLGLNVAFPAPGNYEVYATFRNAGSLAGRIQSAPINLAVTAPVGLNLEAYNYIMASGLATDFVGDSLSPIFPKEKLLAFDRNFGNSVYGAYVKFKLGQWYLVKKDYRAAEALFAQVAAQPDFPLAQAVNDYLTRARQDLTQP